MTSPMSRNARMTNSASMKRPQNKEAAQRLVQVMAQQEEDNEEDDLYDFDSAIPSAGIGLAGGRQARNRSPLTRPTSGGRSGEVQAQPSSARHRPSPPVEHKQPLSARQRPSPSVEPSSIRQRPSLSKPVDPSPNVEPLEQQQQPSPARLQHTNTASPVEEAQPQSVSSNVAGIRSSPNNSAVDQPSSARLVGRPNLRVKTVSIVPSTVSLSLKPAASGTQPDSQVDKLRDKKSSLDFGTFKYKQPLSSALQDELDMLQEENESLLERLRIVEERYDEAEARTRQLEKQNLNETALNATNCQVESFGEGVTLEARLVNRKEAELHKREVALKVAANTYGGCTEELAALRVEVESARGEATYALEQLHDAEDEVRSLRILTQRMLLTREEMEEVVLKRCWLARCWGLCVRYGIHAEIAESRHEYWSQYAACPVEVILAAGRKAKDADSPTTNSLEERERALHDRDEIIRKPDVESMFLVEQGLRELCALKVEEAIAISMAQKRRPSIMKPTYMDDLKLPAQSNHISDAFGLSAEECEDVLLKRAWLSYLWRRAKNEGVESDIAEERLQFWIHQVNKPNSHDAVDVERGLQELQKLGLEAKLWEESRKLIDPDSGQKTLLEVEYQILSSSFPI